jgi:hypothetical protein
VAAIFSTATSVRSIAATIDQFYVGLAGPTATIAYAESPFSKTRADRERISDESFEAVQSIAGVDEIASFMHVNIRVRDRTVDISGLPTRALMRHGGLRTLSDDYEDAIQALLRGEILITHAFSELVNAKPGDVVELPTHRGPREFRVGGMTRDYGPKAGTIRMDQDVLHQWFDVRGRDSIAIWTTDSLDRVLRDIGAYVHTQPLFFLRPSEYATVTRASMERFNGLLGLPVALLTASSVAGLLNLLVGSVIARGRELSVFRAAGGTSANAISMVILDVILLSLCATIFGLIMGYCWGIVISDAVAQTLGWVVRYQPEILSIVTIAGGSIMIAVIAGIVPAVRVDRYIPLGRAMDG